MEAMVDDRVLRRVGHLLRIKDGKQSSTKWANSSLV